MSQWQCPSCKTEHTRNGNSAKNHLQAGQAIDRLFQASSLIVRALHNVQAQDIKGCADCKGIHWHLFYLGKTDVGTDHLMWLRLRVKA